MQISTMTTPQLKQHLADITAEQAHRRNPAEHGIPDEDRNENLAAMGTGSLDVEAKYIRGEIRNRESGPHIRAYFN